MSINQKILDIRRTLDVPKTGYDERGDYYYHKAEDVANAVRQAMNEHGLVHRTEIKEWQNDNFYDPQGRNRPRVTSLATVHFIDVETGESLGVDVIASGSDTGGDKHTRKNQVQIFKEAAIDLFIVTGEMGKFDADSAPEAEPVNTTPPPPKAATVAELQKKIKAIIADESNPIDANIVSNVGARIADGRATAVWMKDAEILEQVLKALENGEAE